MNDVVAYDEVEYHLTIIPLESKVTSLLKMFRPSVVVERRPGKKHTADLFFLYVKPETSLDDTK